MKIKMVVSRSGPAGVANPGDIIDVPSSEGARMVAAGQAEVVRDVAKETASGKAKAEKAVK